MDMHFNNKRIYREKIRLLYKNSYIGIIATLINSLILVYMLSSLIHHRLLLTWLFLILLVSIFRSYLTYRYLHHPAAQEKSEHWDRLLFVSLIMSGIIWGGAGIYLYPNNSIVYQTFLAFILGGMVVGAAGAFSILPRYFLGYSIPALIPIIFRFFLTGDGIHTAMGIMAILFGFLIYFTSKYLCYTTNTSLKLRFENTDLIAKLTGEKEQVEKLNEKYRAEILERKSAENRLKEVLSSLEETQDMLARSEKLAVIGRLASAISHEVLNPVNIINMRLQLLKNMDFLPEKAQRAIIICEDQINRIVQIIRNIAQFSRSRDEELSFFSPTPLNEVIKYVLELYGPEFKEKNIVTDVKYCENLQLVTMDRGKIEQVLFNILTNAIDALEEIENKLIIIKTKPGSSKKYIKLVISDNGTGVEKANLDKIMDPFFTTKAPNKGSGLGLFMSYIIIKNHGGNIKVENNELGGTSIFIELPVDNKA